MAPSNRKYKSIWDAISIAKVGEPVSVRCHRTAVATVKQAVSKEKSRETAAKKKVGLPFAGKLIISEKQCPRDSEYVIINFSLEWDGRRL